MPARLAARLVAGALVPLVALVALGCSSGGSPSIAISGAWVRPTTSADAPSAGYLTIVNSGSQEDALTSATSPAATSVEVHQTSMDSGGMAGMARVDRIPIPAGATVTLQPGAYHLMLMGLSKVLASGDKVELDLVFEHAGRVVVQAEVRQG